MSKHQILAIDDDKFFTQLVGHAVRGEGHLLDECNDPTEINPVRLHNYDIILLDVMMPGMNGVDMLGRIRNFAPDSNVILMTSIDRRLAEKIVGFGDEIGVRMRGILSKPFKKSDLSQLIEPEAGTSTRHGHPVDGEFVLGELESALAKGMAFVGLQPQVSLHTSRWVGCDASLHVRNGRSTRQVIADSVHLFHSQGFGMDYDIKVIKQAVECAKAFNLAVGTQCSLSVCVSPLSIVAPEFTGRLLRLLHTQETPKLQLTLEISANTNAYESTLFRSSAKSLKKSGVRFCMKANPAALAGEIHSNDRIFDEVKVPADRLRSAIDDVHARQALKELLEITAKTCVVSVAEDVEDRDLLEFATFNGFDLAQGAFFSQSLATGELVRKYLAMLRQDSVVR